MNIILIIIGGLVAGYLVNLLQHKLTNKSKTIISEKLTTEQKATIDKIITEAKAISTPIIKEVESWNWKKFFTGMTTVNDPSKWGQAIHNIFNLRQLAIITVIIGLIYGAGWYFGTMGKRPILDWHGKEEFVAINKHFLHICKNGTLEIVDEDKKTVLKKITIKDVEGLRKQLRPYGIDIKIIGTAGIGIGTKIEQEVGAGINILKWYDWRIGGLLTQKGAYVGLNYKLEKIIKWTHNTYWGLYYGKGYKGDSRILTGITWEF